METFQNLLKSYLSFGGSLESSNVKKGMQQKEKAL